MRQYEFPPDDRPADPSWWRPLEQVARAIAHDPRYPFFEVADFMLMTKIKRPGTRPDLFLYKHQHTRHYLNLDDAAFAYRYVPPRTPEGSGAYLRHRSRDDALDALALWELPWMKPELEGFQMGLPWEHRWELRHQLARAGRPGRQGGDHGHLRLV